MFALRLSRLAVTTVVASAAMVLPAATNVDASQHSERIAVVRSVGGVSRVVTMDPDGTNADTVLETRGIRAVDWSPDHRHLVVAIDTKFGSALYAMGHDGDDLTQLTDPALEADMPSWSPDGRTIAFSRSTSPSTAAIWTVDVVIGRERQLTGVANVAHLWPDWNYRGDRLVFTSDETGNREVWELEVGMGSPKALTRRGIDTGWANYSPDGSQILFTSWVGARTQIFSMDADGRNVVQLTASPDGRHGADWNRRGDGFVAMATFGTSALWSYDGRGANETLVSTMNVVVDVAWS